jgi:hypothetical protein
MARTKERKMKKAKPAAKPLRHDHTELKRISELHHNRNLRWQVKGKSKYGATYWQTLAPGKKPLFWPWKEYRILPGQGVAIGYESPAGVSAEEKEAVAKSIMAPDAFEALQQGKEAGAIDTIDALKRIMNALAKSDLISQGIADEYITLDMTERQRIDLIASIKYITRNGKEIK